MSYLYNSGSVRIVHLLSFLLHLPQYGLTALIAASEEGHLNVVEKLLEAKAKPNHQNNVSVLALFAGVQRDRNPWSCDDRKGYSPDDQCFSKRISQKQ